MVKLGPSYNGQRTTA
jgi:hypothetical protein